MTELNATIRGDFTAISLSHFDDISSLLIITDFVSDRAVFARVPAVSYCEPLHRPSYSKHAFKKSYEIPLPTIILDHLFFSCSTYDDPKVPLLRVLDIRHLFNTLPEEHRSSSATARIDVDVLGFTDNHFELPPGYATEGRIARPSICSFHWKKERERFHQLTIAIHAGVRNTARWGPHIFRYASTPRKSDTEAPVLRLLSCANVPYHINERHLFYRKQITLSGRLLLQSRHQLVRRLQMYDLVLATIDDGIVAQRQPFASAPQWLSRSSTFTYDLDHQSGAIICTSTKERWIKIAYPA